MAIELETPVMFRSVASKAVTRPASTGLLTAEKTIGMLSVAAAAVWAVPVAIGMSRSASPPINSEKMVGSAELSPFALRQTTSILSSSPRTVNSERIVSRIWLRDGWSIGWMIATVRFSSVSGSGAAETDDMVDSVALWAGAEAHPPIRAAERASRAAAILFFIAILLLGGRACWSCAMFVFLSAKTKNLPFTL